METFLSDDDVNNNNYNEDVDDEDNKDNNNDKKYNNNDKKAFIFIFPKIFTSPFKCTLLNYLQGVYFSLLIII